MVERGLSVGVIGEYLGVDACSEGLALCSNHAVGDLSPAGPGANLGLLLHASFLLYIADRRAALPPLDPDFWRWLAGVR